MMSSLIIPGRQDVVEQVGRMSSAGRPAHVHAQGQQHACSPDAQEHVSAHTACGLPSTACAI